MTYETKQPNFDGEQEAGNQESNERWKRGKQIYENLLNLIEKDSKG
jgi:hypothetical protein